MVHSIISGIRGSGSSSSASGCATPQAASSLTENLGLPTFSVVALTDREMDPLADLAMRQSPCDHASAGDLGKAICGISRSRTLRRFRTPALRR